MPKSTRDLQVRILTVLGLLFLATPDAMEQAAHPASSDFKVTLLGTSTPNPLPDRLWAQHAGGSGQ